MNEIGRKLNLPVHMQIVEDSYLYGNGIKITLPNINLKEDTHKEYENKRHNNSI